MPSTRVLLSYARADGSLLARRMRELLEQGADSPWLDVNDIPDGAEWEDALLSAIKKTDVLLVLLTPQAALSRWVQKEVEFATSIQKRVVVLKYMPAEAPEWVRAVQIIDHPEADESMTYSRVVGALRFVWREVSDELLDLADSVDPVFVPLVDTLKLLCDKRAKLRPEGFLACVELLQRMGTDVARGDDLREVMAKVLTEQYLAERLARERAYRAHAAVILQLFSDLRTQLPRLPMEIVSIVAVVMTSTEASQLLGGRLFDATFEELRQHFSTVRQSIEENDRIADWAERYGDAPEDWRPFATGGATLEAIIDQELRQLGVGERDYRSKFVDVRTLNEPANRRELKALRMGTCVVVMDVVSVCHPTLFDAYRRTLLDVFPHTLVIKVAPAASLVPLSEAELALSLRQRIDGHFSDRFYDKDPLCVLAAREVDLRRELVRLGPPPSSEGIRATYRGQR